MGDIGDRCTTMAKEIDSMIVIVMREEQEVGKTLAEIQEKHEKIKSRLRGLRSAKDMILNAANPETEGEW